MIIHDHSMIIHDHSMIIHVDGRCMILRFNFDFVLFVFLARVFGDGLRSFSFSLRFGCVIMAFWQSIDHLLHVIVLRLPPGYVRVHILHEHAWRCSLHFFGWHRKPLAVQLLQVGKEPLDFEITGGEFFRG